MWQKWAALAELLRLRGVDGRHAAVLGRREVRKIRIAATLWLDFANDGPSDTGTFTLLADVIGTTGDHDGILGDRER